MIRIAVGCAPNNEDIESQQVLEYTLRKHASEELEITWMKLSRDRKSLFSSGTPFGWETKKWSTPFSGLRWAVPALFKYEGRAIYMDSDCIVQADIAELWNQGFEKGKVVIAKAGAQSWRFCVCMWNCEAVKGRMFEIAHLRQIDSHREMIAFFKEHPEYIQAFEGNWNCIDGEDYKDLSDPEIKIIHYSSEAHQPHLKHALPRLAAEGQKHWFDGETKPHWRNDLQTLFDRLLKEANAAGFTADKYISAEPFGTLEIAEHKNYKGHEWVK